MRSTQLQLAANLLHALLHSRRNELVAVANELAQQRVQIEQVRIAAFE
jgi:Zn-dependent peptidase ImmA (M78 family)